jgi:[acyl-carrier-protein] S-malonyltransferase
MGKIALVFPGQGAQAPGMGESLCKISPAAEAVFAMAEKIRPGTKAQCFTASAEELAVTLNTQPCLYCADLAAAAALMEGGVKPDMLAGFSLGELAALAVSGAFSAEEGLQIVMKRAELMQDAAEKSKAAMVAVVKLDNETVAQICTAFEKVYPVNFNCPGQVVVAGAAEELEDFKNRVKEAGGRCLPLKVGGGFHSPFMLPAAEAFGAALEGVVVGRPQIPVYSNVTALPYGDDVKTQLTRQMISPVLWARTVENMVAAGVDTLIECGPGRVLSGLIARITDKARVLNVEDEETLKQTLSEVLSC